MTLPAPAGRFPFYAQYDPLICGASLIHSDIVLGAAHCGVPDQCGLLFDSINLYSGTSATVEQYVVHPQYNGITSENDLLVMKLTSPLDISPIGYNKQSSAPVNDQSLTAIGFGTQTSGSLSDYLLQVTMNYVPNGERNQAFGGDVYDSMLCAVALGEENCLSDSGGPLLTADDSTGEIVGIVPWGYGCADNDYPRIYARVSEYEEWIGEAICCMSDDPPDSCASTSCSDEFGSVSECDRSGFDYCEENAEYDDDCFYDWDDCLYFCDTPIIDSILDPLLDPCLSPDATTLVETKGKVFIKDVAVGDKVMTASGKYKTVFTISHSHPDQLTSFLSVETEMKEYPLELTPLHMLFLHGKQNPVPAKDVKIGDVVQTLDHGPQKVTNVTVVTRNGFYNPVTMDGTIVVDGIIASTYTSLNGGLYLEIAGRKWMSFQLLFDMIASPFRAFCTTVSLELCTQHQESTVHSMMQFYEFVLKENNAGQLFLLFVFVSFFVLMYIMLSPVGIWAILAFIGMICHCLSTKTSVSHKKKCNKK